jgi:lysozyme
LNMEIRGSVGDPEEGATNATDDVKTVQGLLNMHLVEDHRSDPWLAVDGRIGSRTLSAIEDFQRRHALASDRLIEPGDATAQALSRYSGPHGMRVSHDEIDYLESRSGEGFRPRPYNDAARPHNATIGYGHLIHLGPVTPADRQRWGTITQAQAEWLLEGDLRGPEDEVNDDVHVPLGQNQFDALVDLAFTIHPSEFRGSTLLRLLNRGDYERAADQFLVWRRAGGAHPGGLKDRRQHEEDLFHEH